MIECRLDKKRYVVGIDLHGTLLDSRWTILPELLPQLTEILKKLKNDCYLFICSGNDLSFTREVLPPPLRDLIDGYILENGCVFSDGNEERLLITPGQVNRLKSLENDLQGRELPGLLFYAHRLGTISLFTRDREMGIPPDKLYLYLKELLKNHPLYDAILITHSDVAVDILPAGNSKYSGIRHICPDLHIIAVADSCNDWEFLSQADLSFLPENCSRQVEKRFLEQGFRIHPVDSYQSPEKRTIYKSNFSHTTGVLDILTRLAGSL